MTLTVPALSAVVSGPAKPIARARRPRRPSRITAPATGALVPTRAELTATVTGDPLATVTFAAQVGDRAVAAARHRRPRRRTASTTT